MIKRLLTFVLLVSLPFAVFAQIPNGYYTNAEGKTGATLKTALCVIITQKHTTLDYSTLGSYYPSTDATASGKVWDMYSSQVYTFSQNGSSATQEGQGWNKEHSLPQSWFKEASPMKADLFHVYPTDIKVNSERGSYPFGIVAGTPEFTSSNGCKVGTSDSNTGYSGTVFEPTDEYKGDFARTYFYMATRYENEIDGWASNGSAGQILDGTSFPVFKTWYKNIMLQWHQNDPVSQKEIERNNAVYAIQHNRNPFIDHPEYVNEIWGGGTATLSFTSSPITIVTQGQPYSYTVKTTGPNVAAIVISTTTKPTWLTLSSTTSGNATLSGNPTSAGSFDVVLSATDGTTTKTQSFTINVTAADGLKFTSSPILTATTGSLYSYSVVATNQSNTSANITIGYTTKPAWLNLTSTGNGTANLSGTPTTAGTYNVTLTASQTGEADVTQSYTINVAQGGLTKTETFTNFTVNTTAYSNGSFTGIDGSTWTYNQCAGGAPEQIAAPSPVLGKGKTPTAEVKSGTINGGIGKLSFKYMQAFSGAVSLDVFVNTTKVATVTTLSAESKVVKDTLDIPVNIEGAFTIQFIQSNTNSGQVTIDDVSWTGFSNALPLITNITNTPIAPTTDDDVIIAATASDTDGTISSVELKWGLTQGNLNNTLSMALKGGNYEATIPKQVAGTVYLSITAKDNSDATSTELYNYNVIENQKPVISNISNIPASPYAGQTIKITANINDSDGSIDDAWLNWGVSPSALDNQLTLSFVDGKYEAVIPAQSQANTVFIRINAMDELGSVSTSTYNFAVAANSIPTISNISHSPLSPYTGEIITISANLVDTDGTIKEAWVKWGTAANSLSNTVSLTLDGGVYKATIPAQLSACTIYLSVNAKDNLDAEVSTAYNFTVLHNQAPVMSSLTKSPQSPLTGQAITISVNITDSDGSIQDAWLLWGTTSGNLSNNISMTLSGGKYIATIPPQSSAGTIYTSINAKDDKNATTTIAYNFNVAQNQSPVISGISINPQSPVTGQSIVVSANITDTDGSIQQANVKWGVNANDLSNNVDMTYSGGKYNETIPAQSSVTTIYLSVNAKDNLDATSQSLYNFYIAQNQLPTISNITINPTSPTTGQAITLSANLADTDGSIQEAWIDWGTAANSLTNRVNLSISSGIGSGLIPAQSTAGTIYLKVTAKDNSQENANANYSFIVSPNTGIDDINGNTEVKVYPNPAKNSINIEINEQKASTITVSNIIGETMIIMLYNGGKLPVDISTLKSGVYFVTVTGDNFKSTVRIVKY